MRLRKIMALILMAHMLFLPVALAGGRKPGEMPAPRLLMPNDNVDLSGKSQLEFRWGSESGGNFDHYDFRLYKGTQTYAKGLMLQKDIPVGTSSFSIDASNFKPGDTYCWSLRYEGARKSMSSYSIFKIKS